MAAIASGIARSGADIIAIDGFRGGTGAAPTRIRDNVGIPIELALAAVDQRLREEASGGMFPSWSAAASVPAPISSRRLPWARTRYTSRPAPCWRWAVISAAPASSGKCNWGIATQRPELVKRLNPDIGSQRLVNLMTAWKHEIKEMMGGMGINSIEALKGNRLMLRADHPQGETREGTANPWDA